MHFAKKRVGITPLCFKYREHGHYMVVFPTKRLHFCVEEPKLESKPYPKEHEINNDEQLGKKSSYCTVLSYDT